MNTGIAWFIQLYLLPDKNFPEIFNSEKKSIIFT